MHRIARHGWLSLLLIAALAGPAAAHAAALPAVKSVSAPKSVATGGRLALRVQLRHAASRPAKLRILLSSDKRASARDVKAGSVRVARRAKAVRAKLTLDKRVTPGQYYVLVCGRTCAAARVKVVAPHPGGGGSPAPQSAPGGGSPAPQPSPSGPAPTPTPAPGHGGPAPDPDPLPAGGLPPASTTPSRSSTKARTRSRRASSRARSSPLASRCCAAASTPARATASATSRSACSTIPSSAARSPAPTAPMTSPSTAAGRSR